MQQPIWPVARRCPAAESHSTVTGMPRWTSSQAVNRAPWNNGRVSSAQTRKRRPSAHAVVITASAVPSPPVASAPALQWVRTSPSGNSSAPYRPIAVHSRRSSSWISVAARSREATKSAGGGEPEPVAAGRPTSRSTRTTAQRRLTAVGRAAAISSAAARREATAGPPSSPCWLASAAAMTTPYPPAMPMAGAPRTRRLRIASITVGTSRHSTQTISPGSRVWSRSSRCPPLPPTQRTDTGLAPS